MIIVVFQLSIRTDHVYNLYLLAAPDTEVDFSKAAATDELPFCQIVEVDLQRQKNIDSIQDGVLDHVRAGKYTELVSTPSHPPVLVATVSLVFRQDLDVSASYESQLVVLLWNVIVQCAIASVRRAARA